MKRGPRQGANAAAKRALRVRPIAEVLRSIGAFRGRGLALVYHQVVEAETSTPGIVPTVSVELFRQHVEALAEIGEIVSLSTLLDDPERHRKPRFALTFDDDYLTHVDQVLPIVRALDLPATFFLSGRRLHGLGSYWFEALEQLIVARGLQEAGRLLHTPAEEIDALVVACENDRARQQILEAEALDDPRLVARPHIEELAAAGMTIGFHTLHHEILTRLDDDAVRVALRKGRPELETIIGSRLLHFAYPHGKANRRTGGQVLRAGYEAAWTGRPDPVHRKDDRYRLGRWEPGRVAVDDFLIGVAVRLNRGAQR